MSKFVLAMAIMSVYAVILALYLNSCSIQLKVDELQRKVKNNIADLGLVHHRLMLDKELQGECEACGKQMQQQTTNEMIKDLEQRLGQKLQELQEGFEQKLQEQQEGFDQKLQKQQE